MALTYTVYPDALDSSTELPVAVDSVTPIKAEVVNRQRSAILAIEAELGIQPSSTYSTVRARIDALDSTINNLAEQVEQMVIAGGGSVRVKKDNTTIVMAATTLNFTGDVTVTQSASTTADIDFTVNYGLPFQLAIDNTTSGNNLVFSSGDNIYSSASNGSGLLISFNTSAISNGGALYLTAQNGNAVGVNNGGNIELTAGSGANGGVDGYVLINGNTKTDSLVLGIQTTKYDNSIWRSGANIFYTDNIGTDKKLFDFSTYGPYIAIAGKESSDIVSPNEDGKGCFVLNPSIIDGYTSATYTFNAVLETTDGYYPAEIYLYNLTDGSVVNTFSITPLTTTAIVPTLLQRTLTLFTDIPAEEKLYQARIRFASGTPTASDIVTCRLAEIRIN